jgi:tetratricopeptide (TPR) repeat protein
MHIASESMNAYRAGRKAYLTGDYNGAITAFRWASGLDPDNPIYSHSAALSASRAGDEASAEQLFLRAILGTRRTLGADHPFMLLVARDLADFYGKKGRDEEAVKLAGGVVASANPLAVAGSSDKTLGALAELCGKAGRLSVAIPFYRSALASRRDQYGDRHPKTAACIAGLVEIHRKLGDNGKARQLLEKAGFVREAGSRDDAVI